MAWVRPIGGPATGAGRTLLGPQPCKLLGTSGSFRSPAPAVNHWAPRAHLSPAPGRIPLPFSILPLRSLLPGDLTSGPRPDAETEKRTKGNGQRKALLPGATATPSRGPSFHGRVTPLCPHRPHSTLYSPLRLGCGVKSEKRG